MIYSPALAPTGSEVEYTQCASSYGSGAARTRRRPVGAHPLLLSSCLAAAGTEAGLAPGPGCRPPYLQLISESLGPGMLPGRRQLGTRHRTPAWLRLGSASARLGNAAQGPGTGETGTRRPASHPTRPSHPALHTGRAVSTAAVRIGSRLTARRSPDRGNGSTAVNWTSQPGRPGLRLAISTAQTVAVRSWRCSVC